jgi:hypothetical protein
MENYKINYFSSCLIDAPSQFLGEMSDLRNLPSIQTACVNGARPNKLKPRRIGNGTTINDSR